jgi:putative two-component system response regulator
MISFTEVRDRTMNSVSRQPPLWIETPTKKAAIIDDDPEIQKVVQYVLEKAGWTIERIGDGPSAVHFLENGFHGVVFLDLNLPGLNGFQVLERLPAAVRSQLEFIVVTGHADMENALQALRLGAGDFLRKPFGRKDLLDAADKALHALRDRFVTAERNQAVARDQRNKKDAIQVLREKVDGMRLNALEALAVAAEYRDNETGAHIRRIARYIEILGEELGWGSRVRHRVAFAGRLHDVGKIGIADNILLKPGKLTADEFKTMQNHTVLGHQILCRSMSETHKVAARIALSHHERWDGSGYPNGVAGEVIPLEARVSALADVYDALRSPRTYKPAFNHETTVSVIRDGDGRTEPQHFDPKLLAIFCKNASRFDQAYGADPEYEAR